MTLEEEVNSRLRTVIDPETGMDVVSMGLIDDVKIEDGEVALVFRPSSPFCPLGIQLAFMIRDALKSIDGVLKVDIKVVDHLQSEMINEMLKRE